MPTRRNFERCEPPTKKWHHSSICQVFWHDTFMPPWNQIDVWFAWYILPCPSQVIFLFSRFKIVQERLRAFLLRHHVHTCCLHTVTAWWLRSDVGTHCCLLLWFYHHNMTPVSYVKTAACRLIHAHIALILLSACGTIFVRKHCSHEEYGLGARGRIYGAAKVHHAGFFPSMWFLGWKYLKTNSVMKTAHERRICTMCIHIRICFQIMHSGSWGPMIAASCLAQLYRRALRPPSGPVGPDQLVTKVKILEAKSHFGKVQDWQSPCAQFWRFPGRLGVQDHSGSDGSVFSPRDKGPRLGVEEMGFFVKRHIWYMCFLVPFRHHCAS